MSSSTSTRTRPCSGVTRRARRGPAGGKVDGLISGEAEEILGGPIRKSSLKRCEQS